MKVTEEMETMLSKKERQADSLDKLEVKREGKRAFVGDRASTLIFEFKF